MIKKLRQEYVPQENQMSVAEPLVGLMLDETDRDCESLTDRIKIEAVIELDFVIFAAKR